MAEVLLATVNDIKRVLTFNGNIDEDKIVPIIFSTQEIVVQGVLGTNLYDELLVLVEDFADNATPIPQPYATLLSKYVTPFLSYRTGSVFLIDHAYMVANGGVTQHQPDNSITPSFATVQSLSKRLEYRSNHFLRRLQDYLNCGNLFPEYGAQQPNGGMYPDASNRGSQSWVF